MSAPRPAFWQMPPFVFPGGIMHRQRIARDGDKVVAETHIHLKSYSLGQDKEKKKEPEKDKKTEK